MTAGAFGENGLQVTVDVFGVKDALAELRKVSPGVRAAAVNYVKRETSAMLVPARKEYPTKTRLKGWSRGTRGGRLGYDGSKVDAGIQIVVGGRTPRGANAFPIITIVQKNAAGALYSLAGTQNGGKANPGTPRATTIAFINKIKAEHGKGQRGLWQARDEIRKIAEGSIEDALEEVVRRANRKLVA
jgi:hypothetical protein